MTGHGCSMEKTAPPRRTAKPAGDARRLASVDTSGQIHGDLIKEDDGPSSKGSTAVLLLDAEKKYYN